MTKRVLVMLAALAVAVQMVRSAVVALSADPAEGYGMTLWPDHPRVLAAAVLRDLEKATAEARPLDAGSLARIQALARKEPLASEPFFALGTNLYLQGDVRQGRRLLIEARRRDARVPSVRYFLARTYIVEGRFDAALNEAAALARLVPGTSLHLAPALAQMMRGAGGINDVRQVLERYPDLAPDLLTELARDPANADLLVTLAPSIPADRRSSRWQKVLFEGLFERREYRKAKIAWVTLNGQDGPGELIHDARFTDETSSPPFNWALARDGALVDRENGKLQVTYSGRKDVVLARQVLVLPAGGYALAVQFNGDVDETQRLGWKIVCLPGRNALAELPLRKTAGGHRGIAFEVPRECEAQELRLEAHPGDFSRASTFAISDLQLKRTAT